MQSGGGGGGRGGGSSGGSGAIRDVGFANAQDIDDGNADDTQTDQETNVSLGVELAPISPLELLNGNVGVGKRMDGAGGAEGDDLLTPDPPTVVIDSEDSPPTAKQKKIARVVMAVAFVLLAMSVILVGVTLSMSDHIDDLVRRAQINNGLIRPSSQGRPGDQARTLAGASPSLQAGNDTVAASNFTVVDS